MNRRAYALFAVAFSIGILCLAPINNPPGGTGPAGPAGSPGISGSPGPQGSPGPTPAAAYLVYTALLTQSGTDAPVATVLQNTLGGTVVLTRPGPGFSQATLAGAFPVNKTPRISGIVERNADHPIAGNVAIIRFLSGQRISDDVYEIVTSQGGDFVDDVLAETLIEIRVYP